MAIHIIPVNKLSAKALQGVIEEFISETELIMAQWSLPLKQISDR